MKKSILCSILLLHFMLFRSCNGQTRETTSRQNNNKVIGGGCDGCELMYVGMPKTISSIDTSPGWSEHGQKLIISGTVFKLGGKIPQSDVIIYYWQTDSKGYYSPINDMNETAKRHGHIRGWVKTDKQGRYLIKTIRPAPYPNQNIPAHIHLSIKEPRIKNEYYTDEINFDDDKLLIQYFKKYPPDNRGGSGVVRILLKNEVQYAEHNIYLGLNIPNYPTINRTTGTKSGLDIGSNQPSFIPYHAFGPDKGTQTCPVCKYGRYHGIIYYVGNNPKWKEVEKWLSFLEKESENRKGKLKVFFVYGSNIDYNTEARQSQLEDLGKRLNLTNTALTYVPSFNDKTTEVNLNMIKQNVDNTFIVHKNSRIIDKYVNLAPTTENFKLLTKILNNTK